MKIIIVEYGRKYICDTELEARLCTQALRLEGHFQNIKRMLRDYGYPDTREWIEAITIDGAEGLRAMVLGIADETVKIFGIPSAPVSIPVQVLDEAGRLNAALSRDMEGIPFGPECFAELDDCIIDTDRVILNILTMTRHEITF